MDISDIENYEIMSGKKFRGKYRVDSARMKNYDYSRNGAYFITIVTENRENYFGEIVERKDAIHGVSKQMKLSEMGKIAEKFWHEIPQHFPFVKLDAFVVMPNHVHGIIWIDKTITKTPDVETPDAGVSSIKIETPKLGVSTTKKRKKNHNPEWKSGTLGVIINQYKRICTIKSREKFPYFAWQPRFHDHIIRDETSLNKIREYIILNPELWDRDRNNNANW